MTLVLVVAAVAVVAGVAGVTVVAGVAGVTGVTVVAGVIVPTAAVPASLIAVGASRRVSRSALVVAMAGFGA